MKRAIRHGVIERIDLTVEFLILALISIPMFVIWLIQDTLKLGKTYDPITKRIVKKK